jgi:hypothetical protein
VLINGVLGPLNSAGVAAATSLEDIVGALRSADPVTFVSALLNAPAEITGAFLNGTMAPGGFPMAGLIGGPFGSSVGSVLDAIKSLAQAIASPGAGLRSTAPSLKTSTPELASVDSSPLNATDSTTVTLDVSPKTDGKDASDAAGSPAVEPGATPAAPVDTAPTEPSVKKQTWNDAVATVTGLVRDSLKAKPGQTGMGSTQPGSAKPVDDDATGTEAADGSVTPASNAGSTTAGEAGAGAGGSESSPSANSSSTGGAGGDAE